MSLTTSFESVGGNFKAPSAWDRLVTDLQCPVCLEFYQVPVILPCSHVLCRVPCAQQLLVHNFVRCPVCRQHSFVGENVSSLPRVIALESIIERYKNPPAVAKEEETQEELNGILCQLCDSKQACKTCLECNVSYCVKCLQVSHPPKEPFNKHKLIQPFKLQDDPSVTADPRCTQHNERVNLFCQPCHHLTCILCAEVQHPGHKVLRLDEAVFLYKNLLQRNMYKLERAKELLESQKEEQFSQLRQFKDNCRERRTHIESQCSNLMNEIRAKKELFMSDLEYEESSKSRSLQTCCEAVERQLGTVHSLSVAAERLEDEKDHCAFLQKIKPLLDKVLQTLPQLSPPSPPGTSLNHKAVDLRKELAIIRNISYLSVPSTPVLDKDKCWRSAHSVVVALLPPDVYDVVDEYRVFYCKQSSPDTKQMLVFTSPGEERNCRRGAPQPPTLCLIHEDLAPNVSYLFSVCAKNAVGDSSVSEQLLVQTLADAQKELKTSVAKPEIVLSQSRCYSNALQLHLPILCDLTKEGPLSSYLLYRQSGSTRVWKSLSLCGSRDTHRVFGLESDTLYDLVVLVCDEMSQRCLMSDMVQLRTDVTAAF